MPRTVIPRQASVLSALGFLSADLRQDAQRAIGRAVGDLSGLAELCEELAVEGRRSLEMQGFSRNGITIRLIADCRYARQIHTLPVQVDPDWLPEEVTARLATAFVSTYDARYGHHHPGELCVVETLRAAAFGQLPGMELPRLDPQEGQARSRHSRAIYLGGTGGGWREVSLYKVEELGAGARIAGAALLESESTTILLHDGDTVEVDAWGCLHITRPAESLEVSAKTSPRESARWPVP
jgi:N-methylhydantoinase A